MRWATARRWEFTTAFFPTAKRIAPLSRCGGGCGAISTWIFRRRASPLTLESLTAEFTAYPFEERASFRRDGERIAELAKIWEISWRTARLDAHETYMDTPYWEQLQYVGDTRVQALISYTVAGDDRLAKQALKAFDESRIPEGLTQSRYPTSQPQMIPPFSLLWVGMLHDYWMYRPDTRRGEGALPGTRTVLDWFARYEQPDGLLRKLPWWSFVDWVVERRVAELRWTWGVLHDDASVSGSLAGCGRDGAGAGGRGSRRAVEPAGAACAKRLT